MMQPKTCERCLEVKPGRQFTGTIGIRRIPGKDICRWCLGNKQEVGSRRFASRCRGCDIPLTLENRGHPVSKACKPCWEKLNVGKFAVYREGLDRE